MGQEQQDIAAANGGQGFFFRGSKYEEQFIEQLLSLELVKCFAKVQNVRQLKPITSALDGDDKAYRSHWSQLIRYEAYCKLTVSQSELVPVMASNDLDTN